MKNKSFIFSIVLIVAFISFLPINSNSYVQAKSEIGKISTYVDFGGVENSGIYKKNQIYNLNNGLKINTKASNEQQIFVKKNNKTVWKELFVCGGVSCSFQYAQASNGNLILAYTTSYRAIGQGIVGTDVSIVGIDKNGKVKFKKDFGKDGEVVVEFNSTSKVAIKRKYKKKTMSIYGMTTKGEFKKY
ncbi:hypothetical protein [Viridibacillus sp. FSL R5-0888]|uniref:hypothetical protein n=1 Tax=Viridibacillus sp. FSL R5-0888 TaxID=2921663 RepID=UPI0030F82179